MLKEDERVVQIHRKLLETHGAAQAAQAQVTRGGYNADISSVKEEKVAERAEASVVAIAKEELFVEPDLFDGGNVCVPSMKEIEQAAREAGESCILAALDAVGCQLRERLSCGVREEEVGTMQSSILGEAASTGGEGARRMEGRITVPVRLGQLEEADPDAVRAQAPRLMEEITEAVAGHRRSLSQLEQTAGMLEERTRIIVEEMAARRQAIGTLLNDVGRFKLLLRGSK